MLQERDGVFVSMVLSSIWDHLIAQAVSCDLRQLLLQRKRCFVTLCTSTVAGLCCAAGWLCEAWISFVHKTCQMKTGRRGSLALTFPILHCLRCGTTSTCSCKLALTKLSTSASVSEVLQALISRITFPFVYKSIELPLLQ